MRTQKGNISSLAALPCSPLELLSFFPSFFLSVPLQATAINMVLHLITSLLSLCSHLLPSIPPSAAPSSSSNPDQQESRAFQHNLHCLVQTLQRIRATLYDAQEERHIRDRSVLLWLKELKRLAYHVEDLLSEYRYEATRLHVEATLMASQSQAAGFHSTKQIETELFGQ